MINLESIDGFMRACQDKNNNFKGYFFRKYITKECEQILSENDITPAQLFYLWKNGINEIPRCPYCGKPLTRKNEFHKSNVIFCSVKCARLDKDCQERRKNTMIERYGVEHPAQSDEIKMKIKRTITATLMKNYGVTSPMKSDIIKIKYQKTIIERYGKNNPFQVEEFKEKALLKRQNNTVL